MTSSQMENDPDVPGRVRVTLSWNSPTVDDIGEHSVCFSALDSERYILFQYESVIMTTLIMRRDIREHVLSTAMS